MLLLLGRLTPKYSCLPARQRGKPAYRKHLVLIQGYGRIAKRQEKVKPAGGLEMALTGPRLAPKISEIGNIHGCARGCETPAKRSE